MMDMATWPQMGLGDQKPVEEMVSSSSCSSKPVMERKTRPQKEQALHCPRCNSTNTKFCYYNNYSLSQPRYFCKTCRRYWTEGGSLRNVPVGGGSRKNKRSISKKLADLTAPTSLEPSPNPNTHEGQDLNLAYPSLGHDFQGHHHPGLPSSELVDYENPTSSNPLSALDLMRNGLAAGGLGSFLAAHDSSSHYGSGNATPALGLLDFMNPAVDSFSGYGNLQGIQGTGRLGFPLGDLRQVSSQLDLVEQNRTQVGASGYWTGVLGGSASWAHVPNYGP